MDISTESNALVIGFLYGWTLAFLYFHILPNEEEIWNGIVAAFGKMFALGKSIVTAFQAKFQTTEKESLPSEQDSETDAPRHQPEAPQLQLLLPPAKEVVDAPQHQTSEFIPSDETSEPEAPQPQKTFLGYAQQEGMAISRIIPIYYDENDIVTDETVEFSSDLTPEFHISWDGCEVVTPDKRTIVVPAETTAALLMSLPSGFIQASSVEAKEVFDCLLKRI